MLGTSTLDRLTPRCWRVEHVVAWEPSSTTTHSLSPISATASQKSALVRALAVSSCLASATTSNGSACQEHRNVPCRALGGERGLMTRQRDPPCQSRRGGNCRTLCSFWCARAWREEFAERKSAGRHGSARDQQSLSTSERAARAAAHLQVCQQPEGRRPERHLWHLQVCQQETGRAGRPPSVWQTFISPPAERRQRRKYERDRERDGGARWDVSGCCGPH
jgi:hypothetical protein